MRHLIRFPSVPSPPFVLGIFILQGIGQAQFPTYTITDLGPRALYAITTGINDLGEIAGGNSECSVGLHYGENGRNSVAFVFLPNGAPLSLTVGSACALNSSGTVVGSKNNGYNGTGSDPIAYTPATGTVPLLGTSNADRSLLFEPRGINSGGTVAGTFLPSSGGAFAATATLNGGSPKTVSLPIGAFSSAANGINDAGQVVGRAAFPGIHTHAFLYSSPTILDLGTLPGLTDSEAIAVNSFGTAVGYSSIDSNNLFSIRAFIYKSGGPMTDLGFLPGGISAQAFAINDSEFVVGVASTELPNTNHAFVYHSGIGMSDLNNLIPAGSGWLLEQATGINKSGQIVGSGFLNSIPHVFILTPVHCSDITVDLSIADGVNTQERPCNQCVMSALAYTPSGISLEAAATACKYDAFNWQQSVDVLPLPNPFYTNLNPGVSLSAPSPDPPNGGYTYQTFPGSFPFYMDMQCATSQTPLAGLCGPILPSGQLPPKVRTLNTLLFYDIPENPLLLSGQHMEFTTSLVGIVNGNTTARPPVFTWRWMSNYNGTSGHVARLNNMIPPDSGSGTGGVTLISVNGVNLNPVSSAQISTTASGLAYSRVTQTFNGMVTVTNVGSSVVSGPLQLVFTSLPSGVTPVNPTSRFVGMPYVTVPGVASLAPGQSATVGVQFRNTSNSQITFTSAIYSGVL